MNVDIIKYIRQLAKSDYYQTVYSASKECGIKLFNNSIDLTAIQIKFLRYLGFYSTLMMDIALGDIDEIVLKDEIYEDSYMLFRNRQDNKKDMKPKNDEKGGSSWIFKRPPKK